MLLNIDKSILFWIKDNLRNDILTPILKFITNLGHGGMIWILLTLILLFYKPTRKLGIFCIVALIGEYLFCDGLLKHLVRRVRPYDKFPSLQPLVERQSGYSFPSGHSSCAFAVGWTIFRKGDKKIGIPVLILAITIALSRLYVAVHYPSDVLAGILLGITFSYIGEWIVNQITRRWKSHRKKEE